MQRKLSSHMLSVDSVGRSSKHLSRRVLFGSLHEDIEDARGARVAEATSQAGRQAPRSGPIGLCRGSKRLEVIIWACAPPIMMYIAVLLIHDVA